MKKYIFITPEGFAYKPSYDTPEPDRLDLQIFGFDQETTVEDAIQDLMELNNNPKGNPQDRPFSVRIENNKKKNLWVRENRNKSCMAG